MPSIAHLAASTLIGCSLLACTGQSPLTQAGNDGRSQTQAEKPLAQTPRETTFTPTRGQTFSVVLPSSGGGGYQWHLVEGHDTRVVRLKGERTGTLPANSPPGKFADEIFDFEALASGRTTLTFAQYREWEGPSRAVEQRTYPVVVQ